jgi:hypothetical protein
MLGAWFTPEGLLTSRGLIHPGGRHEVPWLLRR